MKLWLSLFWLLFISQLSHAQFENQTQFQKISDFTVNGFAITHFQKINFFNNKAKNDAHPSENPRFEIKEWVGQINFNFNAYQGDFQLERVVVLLHLPKWSDHPIPLIFSEGKVHWQRLQHQWQVTTSQLQIQLAHEQHLTNGAKKQIKYQADQFIHATFNGSLTLSSTGQLLSSQFSLALPKTVELFHWRSFLPEKLLMTLVPQLQTFQIAGFLHQGQVHFQHTRQTQQFKMSGKLDNVQLYWQQKSLLTATVKKLTGYFEITPTQGLLRLTQADMILSLPDFYSHSFDLTRWQGTVHWQYRQQQWEISTQKLQVFERAMKMMIKGGVIIATANTGIDNVFWNHLTISLQNGQLSRFYRWLPDKKWSTLTQWFQNGLSAGKLRHATVHLHGPLDALFEGKNLEITADLQHAQFNYAAGWPPIKRAHAQLVLKGPSLTINGKRGQLLASQIKPMVLTIKDILASVPVIEVVAHLTGDASDGLRFIRESPLREQIDIEDFEMNGPFAVQVKLTIPLAESVETQVEGQITFNQTKIYQKSLNVTLTDVIGVLFFSDEQVFTKELLGKLHNQFVLVSSFTLRNQHPKRTTLQISGYSDAEFLFQQLIHFAPSLKPYAIPTYLSGNTQWLLTVNFPNEKEPTNNYIDILFETDLRGMTVHLPAPLIKKRPERQLLTVKLRLFEEEFVEEEKTQNALTESPEKFDQSKPTNKSNKKEQPQKIYGRIYYGTRFNSVFKINNQQFERGTLVLGNQPAVLPEQAVLQITGALPELSITDWLDALWKRLSTLSSEPDQDLPWPILIDVQFDQLELWQQIFTSVAFQARYFHSIWQAAITGKEIEGQILFAQDQSPQRLNLSFKRLKLTLPKSETPSQPSSAKTTIEPGKLPPLYFYCEALQVDEMKWGRVTGESQPDRDGLRMKLTAQNQGLDLQAQLQWRYVVQHHQTIVQTQVRSQNTFLLLQQLGYQQPPLVGKNTEISFHAYWQGMPHEFELKKMVAVLSLFVTDGQILEVEPGTLGRLFGLFDIYTLPKRLGFDFKDVFDKGFGFNTIVGVFFIQNGLAQTEHLIIHGAAATVKISGQTHLIKKYFEQIATVYPHLSNPLPLAGVLAGGLGVGAAALIMQQILREVEKAIFYRYRITGAWEKPKVVPLP